MTEEAFLEAVRVRLGLPAIGPEFLLVRDLDLDSFGLLEIEAFAYELGSQRSFPTEMPYEDIRARDVYHFLFGLERVLKV